MADHEPRDELYTGYLPTAPDGIARRVRSAVVLLFVLTVAVALVLVFGQRGFSAAIYEFLVFRDFSGVISEEPYPTLAVERPGALNGEATSRMYLVAEGKFGAEDEVAGLDGQHVQLQGALIYRDDQTMVEIKQGSVAASGESAAAASTVRDLGTATFVGEIVDSKCFLGIMKPGNTKPHRACATRCIAGGIPPVFLLSDDSGPAAYLMLVDAEGGAVNQEVLDMVAEPLEITGRIRQIDDLFVLEADPSTYRRVSE
ncbi:MAG: hypothetical protein AAF560_25455 [Acidobacteriota bacterium]